MTQPELGTLFINQTLDKMDGLNGLPQAVPGTGKPVHYFGWYWRRVDFEKSVSLACDMDNSVVGFCENNKWGYPMVDITAEETAELKARLLHLCMAWHVGHLTQEIVDGLYRWMQDTFRPRFEGMSNEAWED